MTDREWYLEYIDNELKKLEEAKFVGNIEFKVNYKLGVICNINFGLNKSVKRAADVPASV